MTDMRWEEIWDVSLRIQSAFLKAKLSSQLKQQILSYLKQYPKNTLFSVRSSSTKEDSSAYSFAGIHESYINISLHEDLFEKIILAWASLWSDRAILYRNELSLDPKKSKMAVVVQKMIIQNISGLAFSIDPVTHEKKITIEAVEGTCNELVDNIKAPNKDLLTNEDVAQIESKIKTIEQLFGHPVDVEWTGLGDDFTVLQARPVTSLLQDENEERKWYLSLTLSFERLKKLAFKVENILIPRLESTGNQVLSDHLENLNKRELAEKIKEYAQVYFKWKKIYWDDFIPLAHGIRSFGIYYNNLMKPDDPFEFVELLKTNDMLAKKRNDEFYKLSEIIKQSSELKKSLECIQKSEYKSQELIKQLLNLDHLFANQFINLLNNYFNIAYTNKNMSAYPEILLNNLIELSKKEVNTTEQNHSQEKLIHYFFQKSLDINEAKEYLRIGQLSWKLRDDDNILLAKLESALLNAMNLGTEILKNENILQGKHSFSSQDWNLIHDGLSGKDVSFKNEKIIPKKTNQKIKYRQLIGQPASKGFVKAKAVVVKDLSDFTQVSKDDILVCDSIQPQMTFVIPLVSGIVERRGGMLVHSSIIAREMGIPAVNGVSKATEYIKNGDEISLNGYLGIITIGDTDFEAEKEFNSHIHQE